MEKELLAAMLQSESSLYEITEVDQKEGVLVLHDVLHSSNQPVKLVDRGLSGSVQGSALVYTRLIHLEKFTMTSGLGFMFSMNHKDYILNRSRKMLKKTKHGDRSVDTFIVFFHLNRSDGLPVLFENVTT
ncbi:hypothetical protein [Paenibacillus oceani]|uniref:Uncharacterized protein n=1 Tax=Paenibacillus oceani TaxID=2772510 RepID=A0A927H0G1_9BACL|nr:hypothetical protein [Paenibacillus oceani]MBD2862444.1 hypothetical protein [Paenibacillus oceani]